MLKIKRIFVVSVSSSLVLLATAIAAPAQTLTTLANFNGSNGANPWRGALVQGPDGDLFGTTVAGGDQFYGTVFKITPRGTLTTLVNFNQTNGEGPVAGLVLAVDGKLYGTTGAGGDDGGGTVFEVSPGGALTTLYSFCSQANCADGYGPGPLTQGTDENLYGTTVGGGAQDDGTFFRITVDGRLTTLYSFDSEDYPVGALAQDTDGSFYGTTYEGGPNYLGTIFKITPAGAFTTLYNFDGTDGANPYAGLIQAADGSFYGTTQAGGTGAGCQSTVGCGTVFKFTEKGALTTLYSFCPGHECTDGLSPSAALIQATDGNFYSTTQVGSVYGNGTIFRITPGGTLTTLIRFDGTDGAFSLGGLFEATSGAIYGAPSEGGTSDDGTVYSLAVGLHPFVETVPTAGRAGRRVLILGTDLTGATSVSFNGTAATFTVESPSAITTTVPAGATTGEVQVITPGGTLSSNLPFRVEQ